MSGRPATPADAAPLAAFAARTFCETFAHLYPPEDLAAYLAKSYGEAIQREEIADGEIGTLLAFDGTALVGYAQAGPVDLKVEHGARDRELYRLYVAAEAKGAGVAHALMQQVVDWTRQRGASALWLSVWENNERAQRFYRRYGFEHMGEHKFMVGKTADRDFIWRLNL
ncbi:MAG TPA: N-acetyltransferase [Hyphomonadaceae bacterium]|nr:N-acetyltransferase [Hyphomonadaceae bacterium]